MRHLFSLPSPLSQTQEGSSFLSQEEVPILAPVRAAVPTSSIQSPPHRVEQEADPAATGPQYGQPESPAPTPLSASGLAPGVPEGASASMSSGSVPAPASVPTQPPAELLQEVVPTQHQCYSSLP